jgi:hypothetical protein
MRATAIDQIASNTREMQGPPQKKPSCRNFVNIFCRLVSWPTLAPERDKRCSQLGKITINQLCEGYISFLLPKMVLLIPRIEGV